VTFKVNNVAVLSQSGIPFMYGSGDVDTAPSNETKIVGSDTADSDYFGGQVAVGSGRICVGAYGDDDNGSASGSAYIFDLDGTQLAKITASDGAASDLFGASIAVGSSRICVGAYGDASQAGSAYIFDLDGTQLAKIVASDAASNDRFGRSVAVGSGRIVVGALFDDGINDGNENNSGSAYIYDLDGVLITKIVASDVEESKRFGESVAVGCDRIVVGASGDSDNGSYSGAAYIFDLDGNQLAKIKPSDGDIGDYFGRSAPFASGTSGVAVGSGRICVGAYGDDDNGTYSGSAYIFDLDGTQLAKIDANDGAAGDYFGRSVAIGSGRICVGAYLDDDNGSNSGSAYIFDLDGTQLAKIDANDGAAGDNFGAAISVGCGKICVGAYGDGSSAGAAYIWDTPDVITPFDVKDWESGY